MKRSWKPALSHHLEQPSAWCRGDSFAGRFQLEQCGGIWETTSQAPGMTHVSSPFKLTQKRKDSCTFISLQTKSLLFLLHLLSDWPDLGSSGEAPQALAPFCSAQSHHSWSTDATSALLSRQPTLHNQRHIFEPYLQKWEVQDLHQSTSANAFYILIFLYTLIKHTLQPGWSGYRPEIYWSRMLLYFLLLWVYLKWKTNGDQESNKQLWSKYMKKCYRSV